MSTIQIRIDKKTKHAAKAVLDKLGLDMTTAIRLYLNQITEHKAIPFLLTTENGLSIEEEDAIIRASQDAKRGMHLSAPLPAAEFIRTLE